MKVVILAGGFGSRISEETEFIPKPMIEIGGIPILEHIIKEYSHYGFNEFIICAGYKQKVIKEFFANYYVNNSNITFNMKNNEMTVHECNTEPWKVTIVDTGLNTMTGGRIKRIKEYIGDETFLLTYGDGVCDLDIKDLVKFHKKNKGIVTLTAVRPAEKFGVLGIKDDKVYNFKEKPNLGGGLINGGYMVVDPKIFKYLVDDTTIFEKEPLETLAKEGNLIAYTYDGFWQCMDTLKEKKYLEGLISSGNAPWIKW